MSYRTVLVLFLGLFLWIQSDVSGIPRDVSNSTNFYDGDHEQGYVEVRKGAFMFWWLYYAGGDKETAYDKPFIIWVQGGPGIPASGIGNFVEFGPQDIKLETRNSSWVHKRNVLFIDSPVGTGFSYVKNNKLLVKTDNQIARDLVELMKHFLKKFPKFQTVPTHIFSQSYGGKIAPRFAYYLYKKIGANTMKMNIQSVGLGSAFVSPKDYARAYPEYLYNLGFLDQVKRPFIKDMSVNISKACDKGNYLEASDLEYRLFAEIVYEELDSLNLYNVIKKGETAYSDRINCEEDVEPFMNSFIKQALAGTVPDDIPMWQYVTSNVYDNLRRDFMRPSTKFVEKLLNETNITIAIYNGQLDIVTSIPGALQWVHRLKWSGAEEFKVARRQKIRGYGNGLYKRHGRLSFWWIYKAGHSISFDNPDAMEHILSETVDINNDLIHL